MSTGRLLRFVLISLILITAPATFAFHERDIGLGLGYFSQNFLNEISKKDSGKTGFDGETSYLLSLKYDFAMSADWFVAPQVGYTLVPRETPGSTATVSLLHLTSLFGQNVSSIPEWDWYFGPGILQQEIKGKGGTTVLSNGTGTATFALPGNNTTVRKFTANAGTSYRWGPSRFALDLILENPLNGKKRTQSLMISYAYVFGGY